MHIVATSVHPAGILRRELQTRVFRHRQGVHVGPEKNTAAWGPSLQGRNEACRALTLLDPKPQVRQGLKHQSPSFGQIVAQFGFSMQRSTQFDDRRQYRLGITLEFIDPHHCRLPDWWPKVPNFLAAFNVSANVPVDGFQSHFSAPRFSTCQENCLGIDYSSSRPAKSDIPLDLSLARFKEAFAVRVQLALNVKNIDEAVDFYSKLFNTKVNKRKPGYANFAITEPPLKLVLFENPDADERLNHLGVEVFSDEEVHSATDRLKAAGMADRVEDEETCCFAEQNKVWSVDPQGMRWEWYRVIRDAEEFGDHAVPETSGPGCCG